MSLLDSASLVVTPNGYKATKLYSIVPSDGTGDMTFSRAGNTATRVNSSGLIEVVNADIPRLDYTDNGCPKLLLEPQRTNLLTYSNSFDDASYIKGELTITANSTTSLDGTNNADSLFETIINGYHIAGQLKSFTNGTAYTFSFFVKPNGRNFARILFGADAFGFEYVNYNLLTNEIVKTANVTAKIETYSNGWKRCTATATATSTATEAIYFGPARNTTDGYVTYSGNASLGIYAYGAQLETGSYATSYIPTTSASVTRNADACSISSATSLIGQTEGTLFLESKIKNIGLNVTLFGIENSSTSSVIRFHIDSVGGFKAQVFDGTSNLFIPSAILPLNSVNKMALAYKSGNFAFYLNGVLVSSSTNTGTIPACNKVETNALWGNVGATNYEISTMALWKTRLSNNDLAALTSL